MRIVGSEGPGTSVFEGAQVPGPTIRELFGDLAKSWGNSKDWILQLCDGRQLVLLFVTISFCRLHVSLFKFGGRLCTR